MTREQALNDYVIAQKMIEELVSKCSNLKKIIFSEQMVPQVSIPKHDRMPGNVRSKRARHGGRAEQILKILAEHQGELSTAEVATLVNSPRASITGVIYSLKDKGLIHLHKRDGKTTWSIAVHKDRSELNHL